MELNEFYTEVAKIADTETQKIDASEVSRVLRCAGDELAKLSYPEFNELVEKWLEKK